MTGVTGKSLSTVGLFKIPLYVPNIGIVHVKMTIVREPNIRLLGRDFFYKTGLSLIFSGDRYRLSFDKNKLEEQEGGLIFNENEVAMEPKESKYEVININKFPQGEYEAKLLNRPPGIVMPDSIIKIHRRNKESKVKIILGNTSMTPVTIPKHGLKIKISRLETSEVKYVGYKDIEPDHLNEDIIFSHGTCDLKGIDAYFQPKEKNPYGKHSFQINKVCLKCVNENVTSDTIAEIHSVHSGGKHDLGKADEAVFKDNHVSEDEGFPDFDTAFHDIVHPQGDREILNGELSVPIPPTESEILIRRTIRDKIINNNWLPKDIIRHILQEENDARATCQSYCFETRAKDMDYWSKQTDGDLYHKHEDLEGSLQAMATERQEIDLLKRTHSGRVDTHQHSKPSSRPNTPPTTQLPTEGLQHGRDGQPGYAINNPGGKDPRYNTRNGPYKQTNNRRDQSNSDGHNNYSNKPRTDTHNITQDQWSTTDNRRTCKTYTIMTETPTIKPDPTFNRDAQTRANIKTQ